MSEAIKDIPVKKYPYERVVLAWDFTNDFESSEKIDLSNSTASAKDKNGNDVTSSILELASLNCFNNKLFITCIDGSCDLSPYFVELKCQSTLGYRYQGMIKIHIL